MVNTFCFYFLWVGCLFIKTQSKRNANIVLIITDDQDINLNSMDPMVKTNRLIKNEGITFTNAFVTTPLCCPSRSSILTGMYQHNHNVLNNSLEGGCSNIDWQNKWENRTFATYLKKEGYSSFYAGKYLNQYGNSKAGGPRHVPLGWDKWIGLIGNSKYYNYTLSINGIRKYFSNSYLTRLLKSYSSDFIKTQQNSNKPFLMVIAPPAPHHPFTPQKKYSGFFKGKKVPRTAQFNFENNTNKHWLVRMKPLPLPMPTINLLDEMYARRWETLLSVDDLVESVVKQLDAIKQLNNTYIFFTSDNGFHLGQFALTWDKRQMYEFDIRVPLLVRGPGLPKNITLSNPIALIDIAPTFYNIGSVKGVFTDGQSFLPINNRSNRHFLVEYHGEGGLDNNSGCNITDENVHECSKISDCKCQDAINNTYSCVRWFSELADYIYCNYLDKEEFVEAYNLKRDRFQLNNIKNNISGNCIKKIKYLLNNLMSCKLDSCHKVQNDNLTDCF